MPGGKGLSYVYLQLRQFVPNKTCINQSHISALPHRDVNLRPRPGTGCSVLLLIKMDYGRDYGLSPPKVRSKRAQRQQLGSLWREIESLREALSNELPTLSECGLSHTVAFFFFIVHQHREWLIERERRGGEGGDMGVNVYEAEK